MTIDHLVMTATNCSNIKSITLTEAASQAVVNVEVNCATHSLSIGDSVNVGMGVVGNSATVMTGGIVRKIITRRPQADYVITVQDKLCRAVDFFIASDDPLNPYKAYNIKAEDLVVYLLGLAGIGSVSASSTIFTYGVVAPGVPINLTSVWQMVSTISQVCGFTTYCDAGGTVHFVERKPYITGSDTVSSHSYTTGNSGDILNISYDRNTENLRNRVVIYGGVANNIRSTAQATSSYLPAGFYKAMVLANALIDSQTNADATASLNLTMFNRLTETVSLTVKGNVGVRINQIVDCTESFTGLNSSILWLVNGNTMTISQQDGFSQQLTLIK